VADHGEYTHLASLEGWAAFLAQRPQIVFRPNTMGSFLAAVRAGHGFGLFPNFYRLVASDLTCLPVDVAIRAPLHLLSHEETNLVARMHAVVTPFATALSAGPPHLVLVKPVWAPQQL
jgi:DNA-binding transcriptional LysR family regulator